MAQADNASDRRTAPPRGSLGLRPPTCSTGHLGRIHPEHRRGSVARTQETNDTRRSLLAPSHTCHVVLCRAHVWFNADPEKCAVQTPRCHSCHPMVSKQHRESPQKCIYQHSGELFMSALCEKLLRCSAALSAVRVSLFSDFSTSSSLHLPCTSLAHQARCQTGAVDRHETLASRVSLCAASRRSGPRHPKWTTPVDLEERTPSGIPKKEVRKKRGGCPFELLFWLTTDLGRVRCVFLFCVVFVVCIVCSFLSSVLRHLQTLHLQGVWGQNRSNEQMCCSPSSPAEARPESALGIQLFNQIRNCHIASQTDWSFEIAA